MYHFAILLNTVKLGYNKLGHNKLGHNKLGYNKLLIIITNKKNDWFVHVTLLTTFLGYSEQNQKFFFS